MYLVATDIASRGIDVDKLTHVINYEIPEHCRNLCSSELVEQGEQGRVEKQFHYVHEEFTLL
jgi:superfamily II DNA/RNA helicase